MVKVVDDLLIICGEKYATLLMILDLSAFDTVGHRKLLRILNEIGTKDKAFVWTLFMWNNP